MQSLLNAPRLSIAQAAQKLRVHISTVWRWINKGVGGRILPTIKVGKRRYVLLEDLEQFLADGLQSEQSQQAQVSQANQTAADLLDAEGI